MYARYDYNAAATLAQVVSDISLLLTGTTNKASLSASCNQTNTVIISTVAAGWSVFDAAAATNAQVLRALNGDGTTYKYMFFQLTATTLDVRCYESWNATTHTGTNLAAGYGTSSAFSTASGGTVFLFASVQYVHFLGWTGGTFGQTFSVMERTRASAWDTPANGVIPVIFAYGWLYGPSYNNNANMAGTNGSVTAPRSKTSAFADVTSNVNYTPGTIYGCNSFGGLQNIQKSPDAAGVAQYISVDIFVTNANRGDFGGQLYGVKCISAGGTTTDDVTLSGNTWFYVSAASTATSAPIAFPKF